MSQSSVPVSPASICFIACARPASRPWHWRPPTMSAAPGTGTAIPVRDAISRRRTTATRSTPSWRRRGSGRRSTPPSPRSCAISASSPIATTCEGTSGSARRSPKRNGTRMPSAGI
eukprot:Mycagemm_TRINITY_DN10210_c0_g3::TRINITY_DN10210_c0_g3_i1::g.3813::m.3813 type:complete len:116 gc:universal TRINITY_DN10210_c0_g3_i1:88-435(+)